MDEWFLKNSDAVFLLRILLLKTKDELLIPYTPAIPLSFTS